MKQSDHSNTTSRPYLDSFSSGEQNQKIQPSVIYRKRLIGIVLTAIFIASLIVIYVLANKSGVNNGSDVASVPVSTDRIIEVEILDGAGNSRVAQHATNVLRALGYDVVEMKKNNDGIVERSYVLDRSGDMDVAHRIATSLGIPKDKVFQKIDRDLYLDITVVVGKDFSKLKAFQSFTKRNKR
jgi:hypothetical protein